MKKTITTIALCILCWAAVLGICFGLLCAASGVPIEKLQHNLIVSCDKLSAQAPHQATVKNVYNSVCDNYADAVLLGVAANISAEDIPSSVINTRYYDDGYGPAVGIRASLGNYPSNVDYTRYWHGSLVLVRPLLMFTDIDGIRKVFMAIILFLLCLDCAVLFLKKHTAAGVIFLTAAALTHIWGTFTTVEYMIAYIIMLAAIPLFAVLAKNDTALLIISAATGTVTAFADFLTTETLTILVPLAIVFFIRAENGERPDEKKSIFTLISCGASWAIAYAASFLVKWTAASSITGKSISEIALSSVGERVGELPEGIGSAPELLISSLGSNLTMLSFTPEKINIGSILLWLVIFGAVCLFIGVRNNRKSALPRAALMIIAALPLLRFMVLMNHSYLHNYFTYRALMASIMAVIGLVWYKQAGTVTKKQSSQKASTRS